MKIKFTEEQLKLLKQMEIEYDVTKNLDEDHLLDLDMIVTDYLIENGIEEDESVNATGKLCEQILALIS